MRMGEGLVDPREPGPLAHGPFPWLMLRMGEALRMMVGGGSPAGEESIVEVRAFRLEDVGAMRAIWNEVVEAADAFPQVDSLLTDEEALAFFGEQTRAAVAVEPGAAAGSVPGMLHDRICGLYILHPNNIGRCAHVANASYAVASAERGQGVGRALVEDSLRQLAPHGFTGLQFNAVVASNEGAIALYEKLGFMRIGTIPGGFRSGQGIEEDILIFYHPALPEAEGRI